MKDYYNILVKNGNSTKAGANTDSGKANNSAVSTGSSSNNREKDYFSILTSNGNSTRKKMDVGSIEGSLNDTATRFNSLVDDYNALLRGNYGKYSQAQEFGERLKALQAESKANRNKYGDYVEGSYFDDFDSEVQRIYDDYISKYARPAEDYQADIDRLTGERDKINQQYIAAAGTISGKKRSAQYSQEEMKKDEEQAKLLKKQLDDLDKQIEAQKAGKWGAENSEKYGALGNSKDFGKNSKVTEDGRTAVFGLNIGDKWLGFGDPTYDYINNLDDEQKAYEIRNEGSDNQGLYKYSFMSDREKSTYNYLYNTEGKKAANDYLKSLSNELDGRRVESLKEDNAEFATEHPFLASAYRVPANLLSGVGIVNVAGQNAVKNIKEAVTGEYAGPINYNSWAMNPNAAASSITSTVAQNLADKYGMIELDADEYPILSRVLNGKSLGDVYQLGMSMADSAATYALSPLIGTAGTVLLGGSAATQGMLDAVANGATDGQALTLGIVNGLAEWGFEKIGMDNLVNKIIKGDKAGIVKALISQGLAEGGEELGTSLVNTIADHLIMAEQSGYSRAIAEYEKQGYSREEAAKMALQDIAISMGWDFVGGMLSGGIMGAGGYGVGMAVSTHNQNTEAKRIYGSSTAELVEEALELDPNNKLAQKLQGKTEASGRQLRKLVDQNEAAMLAQDRTAIQQATADRLTALGETENVEALAAILTKQAAGEKLSKAERETLAGSKYGNRVLNEMQPHNIRSGEYASTWAENIGTERINVEEYNHIVEEAQIKDETVDNPSAKQAPNVQWNATNVQKPVEAAEETQSFSQPAADSSLYTREPDEESSVTEEKSGIYDAETARALVKDMAESGADLLEYAKSSGAAAYLSEAEIEAAYKEGQASSVATATAKAERVAQAANGKTGWKKGVVRGDGVTIADLKEFSAKHFNSRQSTAYKVLTSYAEATGVNIVLYNSFDKNATAEQKENQGWFDPKDDTLYIDINSGLKSIKSKDSLAKYTALRTFGHEFVHFIEKYNAVQYNEFRSFVFQKLTERGENVAELIENKIAENGEKMSYNAASREVVAEAMTDILPDSKLMQELYEEHRSVFETLLEKLKEFVEQLREHFSGMAYNPSVEANALKEEIEGSLHYMEDIVKMFDKVAAQAVKNYQATVATEEVVVAETENTTKAETKVETVAENASVEAKVEPKTSTSENGYTITDNTEYNSIEVKFDGKPAQAVIDVLKANKFRWHKAKGVWYGKSSHEAIMEALDKAYEAEKAEATGKESLQVEETAAPVVEKKPKAEKATIKPVRTKKGDWSAHDVEWTVPGYKTPIAYSTKATSDLINVLAEENPTATISELKSMIGYDVEAKRVLQQYIDSGCGNQIANEWFSTKRGKPRPTAQWTTGVQEVKADGKDADNNGAVREPDSDRQGDTQVLEGVQTSDVQGNASGGDSVGDLEERGRETVRDGLRDDTAGHEGERDDGSDPLPDLRRDAGLSQVEEAKAEELHEAVTEQIEQQSTAEVKGSNFVIGESLNLPKGEKSRFRANVDAIRLIKKLETEGRGATAAEQEVLSNYVGWGGLSDAFGELTFNRQTRKSEMTPKADWAKEFAELRELVTEGIISEEEYQAASKSTRNAHYTSIEVVKAMYDGLNQLGFKGGRMLEPSSGVGNFVGAMPGSMSSQVKSWTMVELDRITGQIAKHLYPNADVRIQGFEKANIPDGYMDVAIGNVPFDSVGVVDKTYPKRITASLHNYFFAKALDKVRTGGIVMFITSSYTMNSKDNSVRQYIMDRADLLGAIRLPNTAFAGNAGTQVVTDILILKKRAAGTQYAGENFLEAPYTNVSGYQGTYINDYFTEHPEMVLGTAAIKSGMYGSDSLTYEPFTDRGSLGDQIREAFKSIEGKMDYPAKRSPEKTNFAVERANKQTKNGGYVVNSDGSISKNEDGELVSVKTDAKTAKRIAGMLGIRDSYRKLAAYLQQGQDAKYIKQVRKELNEAYDSFVKEHGYINSPANRKAIADDPDCFSIYSLENYDSETKQASKADIFTKDTISPNRTITHAADVAEGLIVSINQTGGVDAALIAKLTGKTEEAVTRELIDSRMAFKTKDGGLEAAATYLSGNVRAKLREAEGLAPIDSDYQNNVEELKKVIPADIPFHEIYVSPGVPWIPTNVYADFIAEMLGGYNSPNSYRGPDVEVGKSNQGDFKIVVNNTRLKGNFQNTQKWGTRRRSFLELMDAMMASRSITVNDQIEDMLTGKKKSVINKVETAAAQEKAEEIAKEFQEWLWRDESRRAELTTLYNEVFNALVTPKYDGSNLTVNGQNPMFNLRPHQADAVQRIISSGGNTLLAHKVGAGKTLEMAAAAMKLRELGLVKKPVFVVPKSLVAQWGVEFKNYYPAAKLLVSDEKSFTKANRKTYANRIANGDYDAVVISYEQFEKIPMSADFQREFYQEQINEILDAIAEEKAESKGKGLTVKEMEKKKGQLEKKIAELTTKAKDEDNIDFEQLGIDSIFVDEAHNFKNLQYVSRMNNISGLGNKDGSQRAFDLYTKVRYLQKLNGGRGIVFATATPVMNSMAEMYIMQKYLQSDMLDRLGLKSFDAWAKQFGEVVNSVEIKPSGQGFRVKQTFSNFRNLNELQLLFRSFSDVLTHVPGLKIPKMKGGKVNVVVCEPGQFQKDYMAELEKRADNVKNVDPSEDNMLKITSDGRKVSYTQRMIDPTLPYEPGCKIYRCCENVLTEYKDSKKDKGTQIIFCDMATPKGKSKTANTSTEENTDDTELDVESAKLYDDMRAYLVKKGIPAKEIAFIHEADTDQKKKKLFADVNDGKVRVLIGSTGKMGVGMNAQKRIVAIHHLDAPWRPGDVEQRDGRAFRQGNMNEEVTKYTYVTEGSFDARLWDILDRKQHFINQIMNGEDVGRSAEDTGDVTLSAAEVKALASGNPLVEEQVKLTNELQKLENLQQAHKSSLTQARVKLADDEKTIASLTVRTAIAKEDLKARVDTYSDGKFSMTIGKKKFTDKKEAGTALVAEIMAKATEDGYTTIGSFAGFELRVIKQGIEYHGLLFGKQGYGFNVYVGNTTYGINHIIAQVEGLEELISSSEQRLVDLKADREAQQEILTKPFAKQEELEQKRARFNEIMAILNPKEEQTIGDDEVVQHQSRGYLDDGVDNFDGSVYSKVKLSGLEFKKFQSEAMTWHADKVGKEIHQTIGGTTYVYSFDADHNITIYNKYTAVNIHERQSVIDDKRNGRKTDRNDDKGGRRGQPDTSDLLSTDRGTAGGSIGLSGEALSGERRSYRAGNAENAFDPDREQNQKRIEALTDREVLALAASQVEAQIKDLDAGERDALRIFNERLNKWEALQNERAELGRTYKEQQFGTNVDREAAKATLERMKELDSQVQEAEGKVLAAETAPALNKVLKKARNVVEQLEREHSQEKIRRMIERRDNAAAIQKYRNRIRGDVDELTNWILHPDNKSVVKHVPDALKNSVIPFLSSINFVSKRQLRGGSATVADQAFMEQLNSLKRVLKQNIDLEGMYSGYTDLPPDFMENMQTFIDSAQAIMKNSNGEFIINQMTGEELKELSKIVRTLKKYIMQMNRFHANAMYQHVYEAGDDSIMHMGAIGNAGNTGVVSNFMLWQQMRPAYAFERFGDGGKAIYDGLRRGQATLAFNTKKITAFAEKAYTAEEVKAWEKEIKTIRLGGDTVKIPVSGIMSLYELSKRPQALGHILGEGIRVATYKADGKKISDVGHALTMGDLERIIDTLTPRQKEVADKLQQFMAKQGGEWGNHVSVARWGEELFGEEHYFPINSDGRHLSANADEHPSAASLYALLNMSFTKELQEGAHNRIILYSIFDVFANHMASMAQYNAFALPILDAVKWFNYQQKSEPDGEGNRFVLSSVREQMSRVYGVPEEKRPGSGRQGYAESFVMNIIKAFNGTEAQGIPADETGMKALRHYNMAQVAFNLRVVVQQPLAITRAALLVDYDSILRGMKLRPEAIKRNIAEMQQYSGIAAWKSLGFYDINISRGLTDLIKHDKDWRDKASDIGMWGAEKADLYTWAAIWSACKEQVTKTQKLRPGADGYYDAVTALFEDVIYKTQVVDSVLTKNEYLRSKGFFARATASFMSEPTTTASMLIDAFDKYSTDMQRGFTKQQAWQRNKEHIVRVAYVYGIGAVILAAVQAVADAFRDDDDYQTWLEKWLEAFGGNLVDELLPFGKLPIVSDFYDLAKQLLSVFGVDTYGNPPQSVFMQWYDSLVKGTEILWDKISGKQTNYTWYGGVYKLLQAASGMSGLPMAAATREIITAWNSTAGALAPSLKVKSYEPSETAQVKYAYQDGWLNEEEAVDELISKGLVDNENEAYWMMRGWEAGDGYSKYDAIYDAVRNGGGFKAAMAELTSHGVARKDVISQVKSQIGTWYKDGEISKQQAISMLTKYGEMDSEEITKQVNKWSAKVVTGIAYEDIKQAFLDGQISESRAVEMRVKYGGYSKDKAQETVKEWSFEKKYGFQYSEKDEAYGAGKISATQLRNVLMEMEGITAEEAEAQIKVYDWEAEGYEHVTAARIEAYEEYCEAVAVPKDIYLEICYTQSNTENDKDANGKSINYSAMKKIMQLINSYPMTSAQKDAVAKSIGWSEKNIRKYKLW